MPEKMAAFQILAKSAAFVLTLSVCFVPGWCDIKGKTWVLLAAGSKGWYYYSSQAAVCHAYQLVKERGISEENIIVMMYDDIADNPRNPNKGVIINEPNGPNVYKNVKIDYKGEDVTPEVFLAVLQGNAAAVSGKGTGRVIKSGSRDNIFIMFHGHGAPGIICFPNGYLARGCLHTILKNMAAQRKFDKMVWYVQTSYSGSMFEDVLPNDINIMAVTSANARENSHMCYCYSEETMDTCLGGFFSVNWMHDAESKILTAETLAKQYEVVKAATKSSHISRYGQMDIGKLPLADFLGRRKVRRKPFKPCVRDVSTVNASLEILNEKLEAVNGTSEKDAIREEISTITGKRNAANFVHNYIISLIANNDENLMQQFLQKDFSLTEGNYKCYEETVRYFDEKCFKLSDNPYVTDALVPTFVNVCSKETNLKKIRDAIDEACVGDILVGVI